MRKVSVGITDDLDGSQGAETVTFGLDGVSYEVDLGRANHARLAEALAPFVAASRRVSRGGAGPAGGSRVDRSAVRARAREAGLAVSARVESAPRS